MAVSTNRHSSFLRGLGVLLLPGPSTTPRPHALPPEFPWQAGKVAFSKQHIISDVIWTPLPLRGGSLSPLSLSRPDTHGKDWDAV